MSKRLDMRRYLERMILTLLLCGRRLDGGHVVLAGIAEVAAEIPIEESSDESPTNVQSHDLGRDCFCHRSNVVHLSHNRQGE